MPRFRPTPAAVHDSPEWKASGALVRTVHRTIRPSFGELVCAPSRPGDSPAVMFQEKAAECGASYHPEDCAQVVRDALSSGLWQMRDGCLVIPAFPPSFEAKRKAENRGKLGGDAGKDRTARWRENKRLRELLEALEGSDGDGQVAARIERVAVRLAKGDAAKAARLTATLKVALEGDEEAPAASSEGGAPVTPPVTVTAPVTPSVTPSQEETPPPSSAPGDPFRGSRGEGEDGDGERHTVTPPTAPRASAEGKPTRTLTPLERGRQFRDELVAAGKAFVGNASDDELGGLGELVSVQSYRVEDAARIARHWAEVPKAPRAIFVWDKATRGGAPVSLGLLLGARDKATGRYGGKGLREAHRAALAWEAECAGPGVAKAKETSPVELARVAWQRECQEREAKGVVRSSFEAWLAQGDDLHRADARAWKARAARSRPKGATG